MTQLESYLKRLSMHPVLRHSAELRVFLTAHDLDASVEWAGFKARRINVSGGGTGGAVDAFLSSSSPPPGGGGGVGGFGNNDNDDENNNNNGFGAKDNVVGGVAASPPVVAGGRRFGRFFKELRQTVVQSTAVATVGGALGIETPKPRVAEEDAGFIAEKDRVIRLEQELAITSQKAERLLVQEEKYGREALPSTPDLFVHAQHLQ